MLKESLVIASKEIVDGLRDARSVLSSCLFVLMGPLVVGLVSLAPGIKRAAQSPMPGLISVFALATTFSGGMNIAMDTIAGERERRSLVPLLLNPVDRLHIVFGKWLAVSLFTVVGLTLNLLGFSVVYVMSGMHVNAPWLHVALDLALGVFPLSLLAASIQLTLSTVCRTVKEAQTYLSMLVFVPTGICFFLVFFPAAQGAWFGFLPLLGQQLHLQRLLVGRDVPLLQSSVLGCLTSAFALLMLLVSAGHLQRDEVTYGN